MSDDFMIHKQRVREVIETFVPIFARASIGDFSQNVTIPETEDEFTSLYVGIQIMLDVIREKITGLESANAQLRERVEEKTALLQSIGDGVAVLDRRGMVTFLNRSAQHLIGYAERDLLNASWIESIPLETVDGTRMPSVQRPFEAHGPLWTTSLDDGTKKGATTYYYVRKDGSRFPVETTIAPVMIDTDRVGTIIVFRDITKEREIEQLKDDFLSLATHQLRNPLTTMRWTMESLFGKVDGELSPDLREKLGVVYQNNLHMIGLVNDLLNVSRLDQNQVKEHRVPMKLGELIEHVLQEEKFEAEHKHITFKVQIQGETIQTNEYLIDQGLFGHCLQNVVSNAVKYSKEGSEVGVVV